ncbi:MAG: peptide-methionine (S)-S-oxide reductase MsrA [Alphaproteobacteria bacterium]|nr:peptide-methionine (S)-S-oxide reductase MsrA [Alphaproteobacteria bacterium]
MAVERAILAGGCFWGMEDLIRKLPGVTNTDVGYTGGTFENPTYKDVTSKNTGHAEAIEITFDSDVISYRKILEFFFQIHDPTTKNRQGNDVGPSYRSAIFYVSEEQRKTASQLINELNASQKFPGLIVTEVTAATKFYVAEDYHQDYLMQHPNGYTCHYIRPNWKVS